MRATTCYIGLGSNLSNPMAQLTQACQALANLPRTDITRISSIYRSKPVGFVHQLDFYNAVVQVDTFLSALDCLTQLKFIERAQKRLKTIRNGPRTIDLDILLYGEQVIECPRLVVPHPRMLERIFVLAPLQEIAPNLIFPNGQTLSDALSKCAQTGIKLVGPAPVVPCL